MCSIQALTCSFPLWRTAPEKEAAYEVLDFLLADENVQAYLDNQNAVPCKNGDFKLPSMLDGVADYIKEGKWWIIRITIIRRKWR